MVIEPTNKNKLIENKDILSQMVAESTISLYGKTKAVLANSGVNSVTGHIRKGEIIPLKSVFDGIKDDLRIRFSERVNKLIDKVTSRQVKTSPLYLSKSPLHNIYYKESLSKKSDTEKHFILNNIQKHKQDLLILNAAKKQTVYSVFEILENHDAQKIDSEYLAALNHEYGRLNNKLQGEFSIDKSAHQYFDLRKQKVRYYQGLYAASKLKGHSTQLKIYYALYSCLDLGYGEKTTINDRYEYITKVYENMFKQNTPSKRTIANAISSDTIFFTQKGKGRFALNKITDIAEELELSGRYGIVRTNHFICNIVGNELRTKAQQAEYAANLLGQSNSIQYVYKKRAKQLLGYSDNKGFGNWIKSVIGKVFKKNTFQKVQTDKGIRTIQKVGKGQLKTFLRNILNNAYEISDENEGSNVMPLEEITTRTSFFSKGQIVTKVTITKIVDLIGRIAETNYFHNAVINNKSKIIELIPNTAGYISMSQIKVNKSSSDMDMSSLDKLLNEKA